MIQGTFFMLLLKTFSVIEIKRELNISLLRQIQVIFIKTKTVKKVKINFFQNFPFSKKSKKKDPHIKKIL